MGVRAAQNRQVERIERREVVYEAPFAAEQPRVFFAPKTGADQLPRIYGHSVPSPLRCALAPTALVYRLVAPWASPPRRSQRGQLRLKRRTAPSGLDGRAPHAPGVCSAATRGP